MGGIEDPVPPMRVIIAACSNEDHRSGVQGFEDSWVCPAR